MTRSIRACRLQTSEARLPCALLRSRTSHPAFAAAALSFPSPLRNDIARAAYIHAPSHHGVGCRIETMLLRMRYAESCTVLGYGTMALCQVRYGPRLRPYAKSGTALG
eukprot:2805385-Rhodomonas_salina.3